ncbi:MAG: GHKL domain-containing protein [Roseburia sp.]|nr:GHKL domain-containing protein [Roseburia sp.]
MVLSYADGMLFYLPEYLLSYLFLLYTQKYMKEIEIKEAGSFEWYLLVMPISSILILSSFIYMDFPDERYLQILMCIGAFLLYFSNAVIFIILAHFTQTMNKVKMTELSLLKKDMEEENFENIVKINNVYRKYMHDVHQYFYQFKSLASSGENEAIVSIIDGWETNLRHDRSNRLYTGSAVVNSLLSRCYDNAKEKQIEIDIFVEDALDLDFIQDADKISMFGNLLDNAVEAAEECEEGKRKINIKMYMGSRYFLIFTIENTWMRNLRTDKGKLLSTKKDSGNHGLGIGISQGLAQKYGGSLDWEGQDDWFIVTLSIAKPAKPIAVE